MMQRLRLQAISAISLLGVISLFSSLPPVVTQILGAVFFVLILALSLPSVLPPIRRIKKTSQKSNVDFKAPDFTRRRSVQPHHRPHDQN